MVLADEFLVRALFSFLPYGHVEKHVEKQKNFLVFFFLSTLILLEKSPTSNLQLILLKLDRYSFYKYQHSEELSLQAKNFWLMLVFSL